MSLPSRLIFLISCGVRLDHSAVLTAVGHLLPAPFRLSGFVSKLVGDAAAAAMGIIIFIFERYGYGLIGQDRLCPDRIIYCIGLSRIDLFDYRIAVGGKVLDQD